MIDIPSLPQQKQIVQLRMWLSKHIQGILQHTLRKMYSLSWRSNEALHREVHSSCRMEERFGDFHVPFTSSSEEIWSIRGLWQPMRGRGDGIRNNTSKKLVHMDPFSHSKMASVCVEHISSQKCCLYIKVYDFGPGSLQLYDEESRS